MRNFSRALVLGALLFLPTAVSAQVTGLNSFSPNTRILSADVNFNFTKLGDEALRRQGGVLIGNITVDPGITIDGVDLSAWLDQSVKIAATPTFAGLTVSGAGASALDVAGGAQFGSGNVSLITTTGKLAGLSGTYLDNLDGTPLTGVAKLGSSNTFTARNKFLSYDETKVSPAIVAGSLTLDLDAGTQFEVTLNANVTTLAVTNVPGTGVSSFTLKLIADGTPRTVDWADINVRWAGGLAPTITGTNTKYDTFVFVTWDGGTTWSGYITGQNF
jgi:hypothetical protein